MLALSSSSALVSIASYLLGGAGGSGMCVGNGSTGVVWGWVYSHLQPNPNPTNPNPTPGAGYLCRGE